MACPRSLLCLVLLCAVFLCGCAQNTEEDTPSNAHFVLALEKDSYAAGEPINITVNIVNDGSQEIRYTSTTTMPFAVLLISNSTGALVYSNMPSEPEDETSVVILPPNSAKTVIHFFWDQKFYD